MFKKIGLYYRTVKYLKPIQIRYRLWYILRNKFRNLTGHTYPLSIPKEGNILNLKPGIPKPLTLNFQPDKKTFTFLNQSHSFERGIDWNFNNYGKLWAYNLNYFDYLHQPDITKDEGLSLVRDFIGQIDANREGLEPYPISLRGINWIKFICQHDIQDKEIDASLSAQYQILMDNLEYHILGNHLLENGCSLLFGVFYFKDQKLWEKAQEIIISELDEQILSDGGHYERSVMYHCIILERLLDCYNLLINNSLFDKQNKLKITIDQYTQSMLGWLNKMQWQNGDVPEVNDHISEMLPSITGLFNYAERLNIFPEQISFGESGYRKHQTEKYKILVDTGNVGPDYVPGHAHSDIFSFLLWVDGQEIITDTGTSTYKNNQKRKEERSTAAHNTVMIAEKEQNEVWSAFRVGRRGHVKLISEQHNEITAEHDGYQFIGAVHERTFEFDTDEFTIRDVLKTNSGNMPGTFYLHFAPGIEISRSSNNIEGRNFKISFSGHSSIDLGLYKKAVGYNKYNNAIQVSIAFQKKLITKCKIFKA